MRTGFYIVGVLKGYKMTSFTNRETGEVKERHNIGIQLQDPDGYGGYNTSIQEIKIDDRSLNDAFKSTVQRLKDKVVMILVFPKEWAMENGRKGITYNFDENSVIEEVK
ncbi:single-stranded DNA-binding protein [Lonepinella koalarum]|uniref:DNA-binding protein n=1 Tax=Lonepinella koalarum TaxID=53417 RepID=UPI0011E492B6|nr:DNA-binding protein [Lonepinella koalarum]TYG33312.1 single-stranded DNA-binding protein [Lonepinella koalarum]